LLSYFKNNYMKEDQTLISYGNRRWTSSLNNFYKMNNFNEKEVSQINYYYFHIKSPNKLYHRSLFQKHKIYYYYKNSRYNIKFFDKTLTEKINMYKNDYRRIYDSGQLVFVI